MKSIRLLCFSVSALCLLVFAKSTSGGTVSSDTQIPILGSVSNGKVNRQVKRDSYSDAAAVSVVANQGRDYAKVGSSSSSYGSSAHDSGDSYGHESSFGGGYGGSPSPGTGSGWGSSGSQAGMKYHYHIMPMKGGSSGGGKGWGMEQNQGWGMEQTQGWGSEEEDGKGSLKEYIGLLGLKGLKGLLGLKGLGLLALPVILPLLLPILLPVLLIAFAPLLLLLLFIPIPVIVAPGGRSNSNANMTTALEQIQHLWPQSIIGNIGENLSTSMNQVYNSGECVERLACELNLLTKDYGRSAFPRFISSIQKLMGGKGSNFVTRIKTGMNGKSCKTFQCTTTTDVKS